MAFGDVDSGLEDVLIGVSILVGVLVVLVIVLQEARSHNQIHLTSLGCSLGVHNAKIFMLLQVLVAFLDIVQILRRLVLHLHQ